MLLINHYIKVYKNKIEWFKHSKNSLIYKILILLNIVKSPSYEILILDDEDEL